MFKQVLIIQQYMFNKKKLREEHIYKERSHNRSIIQSAFFLGGAVFKSITSFAEAMMLNTQSYTHTYTHIYIYIYIYISY